MFGHRGRRYGEMWFDGDRIGNLSTNSPMVWTTSQCSSCLLSWNRWDHPLPAQKTRL